MSQRLLTALWLCARNKHFSIDQLDNNVRYSYTCSSILKLNGRGRIFYIFSSEISADIPPFEYQSSCNVLVALCSDRIGFCKSTNIKNIQYIIDNGVETRL